MAKKDELLEQAKKLGLEVDKKNTIKEIETAIAAAETKDSDSKKEAEEPETATPKAEFAKAGKRSHKAAEEAEAEAAKEERKEKIAAGEIDPAEESHIKKGPAPKVRSLLERRGKKYRKAAESIDKTKAYSLNDAVKIAQAASTSTFDGSLEIHINLNVDPKHADQNVRGSLVLPHGSGKTVRVAVFADEEGVKKATAAGADGAYGDEFADKMKKNEIDFDILISTPQNMPKLAQYARVLGPKGLMPNPKSGTVTNDIEKAVKEAKGGRVEYRVDKAGIVHLIIGKISFDAAQLQSNAEMVIQAVKDARPASVKSEYIQSITLSPSMGPSVRVVTT